MVLLLSFVLLMAVFRSILVPLKAVVMNLLSIGAAYGVIVAIFQWGWASGLIGVAKPGPIDAWIPMFLFAIVFGLSMDYEVFLLSRIKEEYDRTKDNAVAVADGLAVTARVITAAALDHVLRVRRLRARRRPIAEAVRIRAGDRRADRRHDRSHGVRTGHHGVARRPQLVDPEWLDRILPNIDVEGHHYEDERVDDDEQRHDEFTSVSTAADRCVSPTSGERSDHATNPPSRPRHYAAEVTEDFPTTVPSAYSADGRGSRRVPIR